MDLINCKTVRIFAYASSHEQSNKRSGARLKTESETLASHGLRVRRARFARLRLSRYSLPILRKKADCFAVYGLDDVSNNRLNVRTFNYSFFSEGFPFCPIILSCIRSNQVHVSRVT